MKYTIYADCHIGVSLQRNPEMVNITPEQIIAENSISVGDNFELKNCEKKDLAKLEFQYETHKVKFKGRFVSGNHDGAGYSNDYTLVIGNILFCHFDIPLWGNSKAFAFRSAKRGGGFGWINKISLSNTGSISKSESRELAAYARKFNCTTIVGGHVHPKVKFDQVVDGVRVICCPRGKTILDL